MVTIEEIALQTTELSRRISMMRAAAEQVRSANSQVRLLVQQAHQAHEAVVAAKMPELIGMEEQLDALEEETQDCLRRAAIAALVLRVSYRDASLVGQVKIEEAHRAIDKIYREAVVEALGK